MVGDLDIDRVANSLTPDLLIEWWAFGALNGWFTEEDNTRKMTPATSLGAVAAMYG